MSNATCPSSRSLTVTARIPIPPPHPGQGLQRLADAAACQPAGSVRRQIAIVVDGATIQAPPVATDVGCGQGSASWAAVVVTRLAEREARILYALLANQPLPLRVEA